MLDSPRGRRLYVHLKPRWHSSKLSTLNHRALCLKRTCIRCQIWRTSRQSGRQRMTRAVLKFIDAGPLGETQAALIRQQIRSHAARSGANESSSGSATATNAPRKRQRRQHTTWTVELPLREAPANGNDPASESSSPLTPLSGTGMIPAAESPVYHEPFVSVVLHNCRCSF